MERKQQASILRVTRKIHKTAGITLLGFVILLGVSGILLGWKKNVSLIQKPTLSGQSSNAKFWLSTDSLISLSHAALLNFDHSLSTDLNKIDIRPDKGIMKMIYDQHYYSIQIDATTGEILSIEHRTADFIEHLHDGSIIDNQLNLPGGLFKLFYTTLMGLALLTFSVTGFWLWYGPKRMRKQTE